MKIIFPFFLLLSTIFFGQKVGDSVQIISKSNREYNGLFLKAESDGYFIKTNYSSSIYINKTEIKSLIFISERVEDSHVKIAQKYNKDFIKILDSIRVDTKLQLIINNEKPKIFIFKQYELVDGNKAEFNLFVEDENSGLSRIFNSKTITSLDCVTKNSLSDNYEINDVEQLEKNNNEINPLTEKYLSENGNIKEPEPNNLNYYISLWYGLPPMFYNNKFSLFSLNNSRPTVTGTYYGANIEIVKNKIGIGFYYTYRHREYERNYYSNMQQIIIEDCNYIHLQLNLYENIVFLKDLKKLKEYIGYGIGGRESNKEEFDNITGNIQEDVSLQVYARVCYGIKLKLNQKLFFGAEFGIGGPIARAAVTCKL